MLQLAVPLQLSVTAVHQENSPQLSNAEAFKSEMQVKDFKRTNTNVIKSKQVNARQNFSQNGT
jgi:hypothetical protein